MDGLGRIKSVIEDPFGANYTTTYEYDGHDNLASVTQGTQTRTFTYNWRNQLITATNPEYSGAIGKICYGTIGRVE